MAKRTVNEVSKLSGVSIRTLHYYDQIGLLPPSDIAENGYRLYDDTAMERLQEILLFRELEFPLGDIQQILQSPDFDRNKALTQQIALLTLKKEHLENLITFASGLKLTGGKTMDFKAFDTHKLDEYAKEAKKQWGQTPAYQEFEKKSKGRSKQQEQEITENMMKIFTEFGSLMALPASEPSVQAQVKVLQDYITTYFYQCTPEILFSLGQMYGCGGEFTENIDAAGGSGCGKFVQEAITIYCQK